MIVGIGMDIASVPRMAAALARRPERLPRRLLTEGEHAEFARRGKSPSYLASRFAAKEALAKALGTGFRFPMTPRMAEVCNDNWGRPFFRMSPELSRFLRERGAERCDLSLSRDGDYAAAMVVASA